MQPVCNGLKDAGFFVDDDIPVLYLVI